MSRGVFLAHPPPSPSKSRPVTTGAGFPHRQGRGQKGPTGMGTRAGLDHGLILKNVHSDVITAETDYKTISNSCSPAALSSDTSGRLAAALRSSIFTRPCLLQLLRQRSSRVVPADILLRT